MGDIKSTTDSPGLSRVSKESPRHPHHSVTPDTSTMKKPPPNVQPEQKAQASQVSPQTRDQSLESDSEQNVLVIPKLLHPEDLGAYIYVHFPEVVKPHTESEIINIIKDELELTTWMSIFTSLDYPGAYYYAQLHDATRYNVLMKFLCDLTVILHFVSYSHNRKLLAWSWHTYFEVKDTFWDIYMKDLQNHINPLVATVQPVTEDSQQQSLMDSITKYGIAETASTQTTPLAASKQQVFSPPKIPTHGRNYGSPLWQVPEVGTPLGTRYLPQITPPERAPDPFEFHTKSVQSHARSSKPDPPESIQSLPDKHQVKEAVKPVEEIKTKQTKDVEEVSVLGHSVVSKHSTSTKSNNSGNKSKKSQRSRRQRTRSKRNFGGSQYSHYSGHSRHSGSRSSSSSHKDDGPDPDPPSYNSPYGYRPKLPYKPIVRGKLNDKVYWDGLRPSFAKFEKLIEGHLLQVGASYITDKDFQTEYTAKGMKYCTDPAFELLYNVNYIQAIWDRNYMYGIFKSTTRGFEDKTTNEHADTKDGFAAWITLKIIYAHGGSLDRKND